MHYYGDKFFQGVVEVVPLVCDIKVTSADESI